MAPETDHAFDCPGVTHAEGDAFPDGQAHVLPMSGGTGAVEGTASLRGSSEPSSGAGPAMHVGRLGIAPQTPWPLRSYLELGSLPGAVPCARLHSRLVLQEWGLASIGGAAEVVVSELVTNAVQATTGRRMPVPVRLWLLGDHRHVHIEVWDADPRPPRPKPVPDDGVPDWSDEGGRGLLLVASLSRRWSWYATPRWGGKVVWAEVAE